jgi:DNA-binding MarR family transcriptional regulator
MAMAADDDDVAPEMIVWPLERLARMVRSREHDDGLNPAQWEALRYLNRANGYSNSPGALTQYLSATKGTISQTVMALERKGFITKTVRTGQKRSVSLTLTERGRDTLTRDPWKHLAKGVGKLGGKTRRRLAKGLKELLANEIALGQIRSFGLCATCRFFREKGRSADPAGPHQCMLLNIPLSRSDSQLICIEHEPA